jgi:hypothetical protein
LWAEMGIEHQWFIERSLGHNQNSARRGG